MPFASLLQTSVAGGTSNALALQGDGVFLPKLSTASRTGLTLTASDSGLLVYDTTLGNQFIWTGSAWESIPASGDSSNAQVIFNDGGILSGDANFTFDKTAVKLTIATNLDIWRGALNNALSVGIGFQTLNATVSGATTNTAIGYRSLYRLTTGTGNVGVGYLSLQGASNVGDSNTAVGVNTAGNVTNGSNNSFFGSSSGSNLTTGSSNAFFGRNSGSAVTSGSSNLAIGGFALGGGSGILHTGSYNIGIGDFALYSANAITGSNNIGIGRDTLRALSSGNLNTALGNEAGNLITSGSSNIFIGVTSNAPANNSSNELAIGSATSFVATNGAATTYFATATAGAVVLGNAVGFIRIYLNGSYVKIPVYGN